MSLRLRTVCFLLVLVAPFGSQAASCAEPDSFGYLQLTSTAVADCTGYVVLDALEYSDYPTLSAIFAMPTAEDMGQAWLISFSLVLVLYMSAWALGMLVNFFNSRTEN